MRHGDGSGPTTGHQNSSAADRNSTCSSRWAHSFSSATSNSGEKWLAHITPANSSHATTGNARNRDRPRVEHRQDPAPPASPATSPQQQRDRAREQQQRRRDEGQQEVLDHVHRRTASCRSARSPSRARRAARRPPATQRPASGARGTGFAGWRRSTRRTPTATGARATIAGSHTSGSNDQPTAASRRVGGSSGPRRRGPGRDRARRRQRRADDADGRARRAGRRRRRDRGTTARTRSPAAIGRELASRRRSRPDRRRAPRDLRV